MEGMSRNNINNKKKKIAEQQVTIMTRLFSSPRVKGGKQIFMRARETLWGCVKKERKKKSIERRMCALD